MSRANFNTKIYAAYRGEQWITDGTCSELSEYFGIKRRRIQWLSTPAAKKRLGDGISLLFYPIGTVEEFEKEAINCKHRRL